MAKQLPNKNLKCYLDTFGRASGHMVLKDLMSVFDYGTGDERKVIDFIKDRLKGACGGNRKPYVDIMTEVEMIVLEREEEEE